MRRALFGIVAVFAQLRVDTIRENTRRGLEHARAHGRVGARPSVTTPKRAAAPAPMRAEGKTLVHIASVLGVGKSTVARALAKLDEETPDRVQLRWISSSRSLASCGSSCSTVRSRSDKRDIGKLLLVGRERARQRARDTESISAYLTVFEGTKAASARQWSTGRTSPGRALPGSDEPATSHGDSSPRG